MAEGMVKFIVKITGSSAGFVLYSISVKHSLPEQIKLGAPVHLALD
jgi:hypothetical protein